MPGLGEMGETNLTPSQIQSGWSAPSSQTHTPAPAAVPPHVYSPMSFDHMSDQELLNMVAQNMIVLKKEFSQLQGAYEAQHDQIALLRAELEEHWANQSHEEKILWVTSYFEGAAEDWVRPYKERKVFRSEAVPLLEDIDVFWAEFTKHYVDTNRNEKYRQKWNNLRQKASVQEYTREFQQYSVSLGYSNETLRNKYYNGLKNEIKDIMLSTMFQWRRATAQQVYDKAEEIANHIESTCLSNPSASTICATPTVSISNPNSPPTCTRLNVGDNVYMIDPTTRYHFNCSHHLWQYAKCQDERPAAAAPIKPIIAPTPVLASNSKGPAPMDLDGRGFANLTCHVCGGKGHFARNCPSKPMSGHVANVEWSWERPKEESQIEVVSNEEESGKGKAKAD
ncbi:hypothetical protein RhiTH_001731 [Rhizoctonia solani]